MNKLQQHLKNETDSIRLSDAEKSAMRTRLREAMCGVAAPALPTRTVPSPYVWFFAPRSMAFSAIALLLVISTGTAYAAEGSLPGGTLYGVKVSVIEPIKVALATSPSAKAQVNANIATERVREAETLAVQGTLTPERAKQISDSYNEHVTLALALAKDSDEATATTSARIVADAVEVQPARVSSVATANSSTTVRTMALTKQVRVTGTAQTHATSTVKNINTLTGRLHASLEVQSKILKTLNAGVRLRQDAGEKGRGTATTTKSDTSTEVPMKAEEKSESAEPSSVDITVTVPTL